MNRGRSPDGVAAGTSAAPQQSWLPDRAGSPGQTAPATPVSRNSLTGLTGAASLTASSFSGAATANAARTGPAGGGLQGKSGSFAAQPQPKDPASMTWPGNTFARQPLQPERIVPGAAPVTPTGAGPRPSVGPGTPAPPGQSSAQAPPGQVLSPRSRPVSQVPAGAESRAVSRSQDATSLQRTGLAPAGPRFLSTSPSPQAQPVAKSQLRQGWKR